jgi:hypothetical protein
VAACRFVARGRGIRRFAALALGVAVVTAAGCGGSQTFSASEFIGRVNAEGVSIQLGHRLASGGDTKELYAVKLPPLPGEPAPPAGSEGGPGASGSLYVYGNSDGANDQFDACRSSGGLHCFRAANVAVVLDEESSGLEVQRLAVAVKRLATQ